MFQDSTSNVRGAGPFSVLALPLENVRSLRQRREQELDGEGFLRELVLRGPHLTHAPDIQQAQESVALRNNVAWLHWRGI